MKTMNYNQLLNKWRPLVLLPIQTLFRRMIVILLNLIELLHEVGKTKKLNEKLKSILNKTWMKIKIILNNNNKLPTRRKARDSLFLMFNLLLQKNGANSQNQKSILEQKFTQIECIHLDAQVSKNYLLSFSRLNPQMFRVVREKSKNLDQLIVNLQVIVMVLVSC